MRWFGAGERGFAMSIRQTAVPLGGGLGALILPSLASRYGFARVWRPGPRMRPVGVFDVALDA
jgi:sugar phosphate permease